jgi:hypothetical protein
MPKLKKKAPPAPAAWALCLGDAGGKDSSDFFVLGQSSEYDEAFGNLIPITYDSTTGRYTFILHYKNRQPHLIHKLTDDLLALWFNGQDKAYAAGFPRGVLEITPKGCTEHAFKGHQGVFCGLWGTGEDHLFACGFIPAFVLYRRFGKWDPLALPGGGLYRARRILRR